MIYWGIDPGSETVALVGISDVHGLIVEALRGTPRPRPTKKEPNPEPLNGYREASALARRIVNLIVVREVEEPEYSVAVEGPAIGKFGRQDTLAAARQALFCALEVDGIESKFRTISPATAKKALTGYAGADKRRMREAAAVILHDRWGWRDEAFLRYNQGQREAIADALGVAMASKGLFVGT